MNNIKKQKRDWWLVNGLVVFLSGLFFIYRGVISGNRTGGIIVGGISLLLGLSLFQRSKIGFWLLLADSVFASLNWILLISKNTSMVFTATTFYVALRSFFVYMLWSQANSVRG